MINKIDTLPDRGRLDGLLRHYPHAIPLSARTGEGLNELAHSVSDALSRSFVDVHVEVGIDNGRLLAYLAAHGEVFSKRYTDSRVIVHCRISPTHLAKINGEAIRVHGDVPVDRDGSMEEVA